MTLSTDETACFLGLSLRWQYDLSFLSFWTRYIFHCPSCCFCTCFVCPSFWPSARFDISVFLSFLMPIVYSVVSLVVSIHSCLTIRKSQYTQFLQGRPWEDGRPLQCSALVYSHSMRNIRRKRYSSQQNRTYS